MASLPQCIQSAKQLYELRSSFRDASVLITAIYSESMVIAASLSQVQNLLQYETLQNKPQLLETFDRALTGCRIVYGCLQDEVQDLVAKVGNNDLKFKDRAKFAWKEDNFKELLTQIRGQQTTLSLLIQGLQMESLADIRRLVADNSITLDQVVKRSRTLRQSHPCVEVPETILSPHDQASNAADAESILKSADFTFDNEVINSRAYRRAMALYTSRSSNPALDPPGADIEDDDITAVETNQAIDNLDESMANTKISSSDKEESSNADPKQSKTDVEKSSGQEKAEHEQQDLSDSVHQDLFDSLENDILAFMPSSSSNASYLNNFKSSPAENAILPENNSLTPAPLRQGNNGKLEVLKKDTEEDEKPPPLPPRRPSGHPSHSDLSKKLSMSSDDGNRMFDEPLMMSKVPSNSSYTTLEPSQSNSTIHRKPLRKPSSFERQDSHTSLSRSEQSFPECILPIAPSYFQSAEMHAVWLSLADSERRFVSQMTELRVIFYDSITRQWPVLSKHLEVVLVGEKLVSLNNEILLQTIEQQVANGASAVCNSAIFEVWTNRVHKLYREYCQQLPHAVASFRTTQKIDPKFGPFVDSLGLSNTFAGMSLEDYFRLPVTQLQLYIDSLQNLLGIAKIHANQGAQQEVNQLQQAMEATIWLKTLTDGLLNEAQNRENVRMIARRLDTDQVSQLRLLEPTRQFRYQGGVALKSKGHVSWTPVHAILFDNYLLWGKVRSHKNGKADKISILDTPIAVNDMKPSLPEESHQFQKTTMLDRVPQGSVL